MKNRVKMKMKMVIVSILALLIVPAAKGFSDDSGTGAIDSLESALDYALMHNPGLASSYATWQGQLAVVRQERSLADPEFTIGYFLYDDGMMGGSEDRKLSLMQRFPGWGKLSARSAVAGAKALTAGHRFQSQRLKLCYRVKEAWYEYAYLMKSLELARDDHSLMKYYEQVVRSKYQGVLASHPDIVRSQIELAVLSDVVVSLERLEEPQSQKLRAIMDLPAEIPLERPVLPDETLFMPDQILVSKLVAEFNPDLRTMTAQVDASRSALDLAERVNYPDFALGLEDAGREPVMLMFSINIPVWQERNKAIRRQAVENMRASELQRREIDNESQLQVIELLYRLDEAVRKIKLNRDVLLPQFGQLVKVSEAAYRDGAIDFLSLIDARRQQLQYELNYYRARTDYLLIMAELDMLTGGELPTLGVEVKQ
ncbi:MAG: TolC family protein [Sedimentisphaerales bacterium]|nr:TolC family protein [Sedimentisphaerales bacterium]MBN2842454.1 TolC family protein [Sedimentisphaerales bacterium]